ncbi:hypothetical protein GCM10010400_14820 [Streptomyces aculeolatus]|uniref:hypothetical protein n=1 Tax=Streptomyces aculeolatus TaxID=270689 RepID=UPI001CEDD1E1|nr:hypothetical protein [Streptomyces aculeolatus]
MQQQRRPARCLIEPGRYQRQRLHPVYTYSDRDRSRRTPETSRAGSETFALLSVLTAAKTPPSVRNIADSLHLTVRDTLAHAKAACQGEFVTYGPGSLLYATPRGRAVIGQQRSAPHLLGTVHADAVSLHLRTGCNVAYHHSPPPRSGSLCALLDVVCPLEVLEEISRSQTDDSRARTAASRVVAAFLPFGTRQRLGLLPEHTSRWLRQRNYEHTTQEGWDTIAVAVHHAGTVAGAISLVTEKRLSEDHAALLARHIRRVASQRPPP